MRALLISVILASAAAAQTQVPNIITEKRGPVSNFRVEGALAPSNTLGCTALDEVRNTFTPPDLYLGVATCIAQDSYDSAANLFALAGLYARFDAERVADKSAGEASSVLIMSTFSGVADDKKAKFAEAIERVTENPESLSKLCAAVGKIGMPDYFPRYMVLHGLRAVTGNPLEGALRQDFDSAQVWATLQAEYLHCTD